MEKVKHIIPTKSRMIKKNSVDEIDQCCQRESCTISNRMSKILDNEVLEDTGLAVIRYNTEWRGCPQNATALHTCYPENACACNRQQVGVSTVLYFTGTCRLYGDVYGKVASINNHDVRRLWAKDTSTEVAPHEGYQTLLDNSLTLL